MPNLEPSIDEELEISDGFVMMRSQQECPECGKRTRHIVKSYIWDGELITCCLCGTARGNLNERGTPNPTAAQEAKEAWKTALNYRDGYAALQKIMARDVSLGTPLIYTLGS